MHSTVCVMLVFSALMHLNLSIAFCFSSLMSNISSAFFDGSAVLVVVDNRLSSSHCPANWFHQSPAHVHCVYDDRFSLTSLVPLTPSPSLGCLVLGHDWMNAIGWFFFHEFMFPLSFLQHPSNSLLLRSPLCESPANDANFESDPLSHLGSDASGVSPSSLSLPPRFVLSLSSVTASVPVATLSCDQSVDCFYDDVVKSHGVSLRLSCFSTDCGVSIRLLVITVFLCR